MCWKEEVLAEAVIYPSLKLSCFRINAAEQTL